MTKRQRSPNYPILDLEKALLGAREIYDRAKGHPINVATAQDWWGYKAGSSKADQYVAALRSYGLIEVTGSGGNRQIRITEATRRILLNASDAESIIKDCAKAPTINAELLSMATSDGLPPQATIRHYLLFDREDAKFGEDVVDNVIERFMATISFAKLDSRDIIESGNEGEGLRKKKDRKPETGEGSLGVVRDLDIPLQNGGTAVFPVPMTPSDYALLKTILNGLESGYVKEPEPSQAAHDSSAGEQVAENS